MKYSLLSALVGFLLAGIVPATAQQQLTVDVAVTNIPCATQTTGGAVYAVVSNGQQPYSYVWNDGSTGPDIQNLPVGLYTVTVIDAVGSTASGSGTVQAPALLEAEVTSLIPSCGGSENGQATVQASGGTPPYTFKWEPGGITTATATGLAPGNYTVDILDANLCSFNLSVNIPDLGTMEVILQVISATCTGINDGSVKVVVDPPGDYHYNWNVPPYEGVAQVSGLAVGTAVTVTVTDPESGCTGTASTVMGAHNAIFVKVTDVDIQCAGQSAGSALASASGGIPPYTYTWLQPPTGPVLTTGPAISGLAPGAYLVTVADSRGCQSAGVADIGLQSNPHAVISSVEVVTCGDSLSTVQFTSMSTDPLDSIVNWVWIVPTPTDTIIQSNVNPLIVDLPVGYTDTATLIVTSSTGCMDTATVKFTVPGLPHISISPDSVLADCQNLPIYLEVLGGQPWYTYQWSPTTGLTLDSIPPNATVDPDVTTQYQLIASDQGCRDTVQFVVVRLTPTDLSVNEDHVQTCDSLYTLFATTKVTEVIWVNEQGDTLGTAPYFNPVTVVVGPTAVYTAIATNTFGCSDSISVTVSGVQLDIEADAQIPGQICQLDTLQLGIINHHASDTLTYHWSSTPALTFIQNDSPNPMVTGMGGTYDISVTVTNQFGCSDSLHFPLQIVPKQTIDDSIFVDLCQGRTVPFFNHSGFDGVWNFGDGSTSTETNPVHAYATGGNYQVTFTVADSLCVMPWDSLIHVNDSLLSAPVIGHQFLNCVDSIRIQFFGSASFPVTTWSWTFDGGIPTTSNQQNPEAVYVQADTFRATLVVTDANGCTSSSSIELILPGIPDITLNPDSIAIDCNNLPINIQVTGAQPGYTYTWTPTTGLTLDGFPPLVIADPDVTTQYTLVADNMGCKDTSRIVVIRRQPIDLAVIDDDVQTCDSLYTLFVTTKVTEIVWVNAQGDTLGNPPPFNPVTVVAGPTAVYTAIATDAYGCKDSIDVSVTGVHIDVDLMPDLPNVICQLDTLQLGLINRIPDDTLTYHWSSVPPLTFISDTSASPLVTGMAGNYDITAVVTNQYGCTDTIHIPLQITEKITIDDSISIDLCHGTTVSFFNTSGYAGIWHFGDGTTSTETNPVHEYAAGGDYLASYTLLDTLCVMPWDSLIHVNDTLLGAPVIGHAFLNCRDSIRIRFFGSADFPVSAWSWTFEGGIPSTSSQQNPEVVYVQLDTFRATLVVTDVRGCTSSSTVSLVLPEIPDISLNPDSIAIDCNNLPITIEMSGAQSGYTYTWTPTTGLILDGFPPIVIADPDVTTQYTLIADNMGCKDTARILVIRRQPVDLAVIDDDVQTCDSLYTLFVTTKVTEIVWVNAQGDTIGNPPPFNPVTVVAGPTAVYTAIATDAYGCKDSVSVSVTGVHIDVELSTDLPNIICELDTLQLVVINRIPDDTLTFQWSSVPPLTFITDTSASPLVTGMAGDYVITAVVTNQYGCSDTLHFPLHINEKITIDDSISIDLCHGTLVSFFNTSGYDGTWNFGDGTTSTETNPVHEYAAGGDYLATFTLQDTLCVMPWDSLIHVNDSLLGAPVIGHQFLSCGDSVKIQFTGSSDSPIVNWHWTFEGGIPPTSNEQNPMVIYVGVDTFRATLVITDANGCTSSSGVALVLPQIPDISLTPDSIAVDCSNQPVTLTLIGGQPGYTYVWSPQDGLVLTDFPPTVVADPDSTTLYQLVANNMGCTDTVRILIIRVDSIELSVPTDHVETCDSLYTLFATSSVPNVIWINAQGDTLGTAPVFNPVTVVTGPTAIYTAIATDVYGCMDSISVSVTGVFLNVEIDPGLPDHICELDTLQIGLINHNPGDTLHYNWSADPALTIITDTSANPLIHGAPGEYVITVAVSNQFGCLDTLTYHLLIDPKENIDDSISIDLCQGKKVSFFNNSGYPGTWHFGDGSTSTDTNPMHLYQEGGDYPVTFIPADSLCVMSWDSLVHVNDTVLGSPTISWEPLECIDSVRVKFYGGSTHPGVTWAWTFEGGNPATSNEQNPVVTYLQEDTVQVVLVITDEKGCTSSDTLDYPVLILRDHIDREIFTCIDSVFYLNPDGVDETATYQWTADPPDPTLVPTDKNPAVHPLQTTTYSVTITDGDECSATGQVRIIFLEAPVLQVPTDTVVCNDDVITVVATGTGISYEWSDTLSFDPVLDHDASIDIVPVKNGIYYVRSVGVEGCYALDSIKINNAQIDVAPPEWDGQLCLGEETQLDITNLDPEDILTYHWTPNLPNAGSQVVSPDSSTVYHVVIENQFGCKDSLDFAIQVNWVQVEASITGKDTICPDQSTTLLATPAGNGGPFAFLWSPGSSLDDDTSQTPVASPDGEQVYTVTVTDQQGCTATDDVTVYYISGQCVEPYIFIPKAFTPNNDSNNDFFIVRGVNITELKFVVWDRWGEKVYETNDPAALGWDGTFNGKELTPDSYAWYVRARCGNGAVYEKKGDVTLLK